MTKGLAFDRASVRTYHRDGSLHVERANISKANVCPYVGREIPEWQALGLDADRVYKLLRAPEELEKAVESFNHRQVLNKHVPVFSHDHQPGEVIGSTGTDAEFDGTYLTNSLVFWVASAIKDIEDETRKELSSGYHYRADMTPGTYQGEDYDGVMRDIVANHVALVKEGRAGSDVVVGDSKETLNMSKTVLSRKAAMVQGAAFAFLKPRLAQDAKIDLTPALKGVTAKSYVASKPAIAAAITAATKGKLAQDADLNDLTALLDTLDGVDPVEGQDEDSPASAQADQPAADDNEEMIAKIVAAVKAALGGAPAASDEDKPAAKTEDDKPAAKDEDKDMVSKPAMDAAISAAVTKATADATKRQQEIRDAERAVRPYVGELAMAHDSSEAVYRTALKAMGVEVTGVHASALPTILKLQPLPDAKPAPKRAVAMDAASAKGFAERFPEAAHIQTR